MDGRYQWDANCYIARIKTPGFSITLKPERSMIEPISYTIDWPDGSQAYGGSSCVGGAITKCEKWVGVSLPKIVWKKVTKEV